MSFSFLENTMTALNTQHTIRTALIIALIQFTNALEYMMINPIFLHIAHSLDLPVSQAGYVASIYTLASVLSGILAFFVIDGFNKRKILIINMLLLALMTALTPFATSLWALIIIRFISGLFGGITLGVGMALLINQTPAERRGKAIAIVLSAFPIVSIAGLPLVLWLANALTWHVSFWVVSVFCLSCIPPLMLYTQSDPHEEVQSTQQPHLQPNSQMLFGACANGLANFGPFILIPLLAPLITDVLHQPITFLPLLFLMGGMSAFISTKLTGWACDRYSPLIVATLGTLAFMISLWVLLLPLPLAWRTYGFMGLFMAGTYSRIVAATVLAAEIPTAAQRAGFNVLQTALGHLSASAAFLLSAWWFSGRTINVVHLRWLLLIVSISALLLLPYLHQLNKKANLLKL